MGGRDARSAGYSGGPARGGPRLSSIRFKRELRPSIVPGERAPVLLSGRMVAAKGTTPSSECHRSRVPAPVCRALVRTGRAGFAGRTGARCELPRSCAVGAKGARGLWIESMADEPAGCEKAALALPGAARKPANPAITATINHRSGFILSSEPPAAGRDALTRGYTGVSRRFRNGWIPPRKTEAITRPSGSKKEIRRDFARARAHKRCPATTSGRGRPGIAA